MKKKDVYEVGDEVCTHITGMVGDFRAKVIRYDTRYSDTSTQPVLEVLDKETGEKDPSWQQVLKSGDHIIRGIWGT